MPEKQGFYFVRPYMLNLSLHLSVRERAGGDQNPFDPS
jgi:hypothetical protein